MSSPLPEKQSMPSSPQALQSKTENDTTPNNNPQAVHSAASTPPIDWDNPPQFPENRKQQLIAMKSTLETYLERLHNAAFMRSRDLLGGNTGNSRRTPTQKYRKPRTPRKTKLGQKKHGSAKYTPPNTPPTPLTPKRGSSRLKLNPPPVVVPVEETEDDRASSIAFNQIPMQTLTPKLLHIVEDLSRNEHAYPFLKPVDPIALGIPTYFNIIKHPMDLGTVQNKLIGGAYLKFMDFEYDLKLIWENARTFNGENHDVHRAAIEMEWAAVRKLRQVKRDKALRESCHYVYHDHFSMPSPVRKPAKRKFKGLTDKQKVQLQEDLECVSPETLVEVRKLLGKKADTGRSDEVSIPFDAIDNQTLSRLRSVVPRSKDETWTEDSHAASLDSSAITGGPHRAIGTYESDSSSSSLNISISSSALNSDDEDLIPEKVRSASDVPEKAVEFIQAKPKDSEDSLDDFDASAFLSGLGAAPST